ncbi:MAG: caspase family protein, partial [Bacteroidetes bacterium]|nr:caspase family protein [Bacteroidota bacterium]
EDVEIRVYENTRARGLNFASSERIGDIYPNSTKTIELMISGEMEIESGQADFTIEIRERNGFDAGNLYITIPTAAYQPPKLEIADYHFASELGGKMRLGVPITLKMAVQNTGSGEAQDVKVVFNLPENVFSAGKNEFALGDLYPGQSEIIDFEFFTNRRFTGDEVPIFMEITDRNNLVREKASVSVRINQMLEINDRVIINAKPGKDYEVKDVQLLSDVDRNLPQARMKNGNAVAVVIGNRDYQNPDVPSVDFALQDAASMKKYLIESFGFDENNIVFLPNATQADFNGVFGTKEDHRARLYNLVKPDQSDVFIFYSGHGAPDLESKEAYFVPVDCDPSLVKFNGYAINTFYDNLAKIPYRSLNVVIDACFSGTSDRGTLLPQSSLVRVKASGSVLNDPNAMIFTSASGTEIASWYPEKSHSLFTYYFLKGLQGAANKDRDGSLSLGEMSDYLIENVPYEARRMKNRVQTPQVYGRNERDLLRY